MSWLNEEIENRLNKLFNANVPSMGAAETHGGECIRAVTRLAYRYFNDGDYFFEGYGCETCGSQATFLKEYTNYEIKQLINSGVGLSETDYIVFLNKLATAVMDYAETQLDKPLIIDGQDVESEWEEQPEEEDDYYWEDDYEEDDEDDEDD